MAKTPGHDAILTDQAAITLLANAQYPRDITGLGGFFADVELHVVLDRLGSAVDGLFQRLTR